jgi:hypothetical protein
MDPRRALNVVHRDPDLVLALSSSSCLILTTMVWTPRKVAANIPCRFRHALLDTIQLQVV